MTGIRHTFRFRHSRQPEHPMKSIQIVVLTVATLIVATSITAWSQTGHPDKGANAPASGAAASALAASAAASPANVKKADRALRRKVYAAIGKHREISAGTISVVAKGGAVTLHGTVTDASQIDKVAEIAKGVPGVTSVVNKLTVQKPFDGI
jgi:hyperosmotically inducible periplasmic protein